jgi:bifunctional UDP-N-acetylglucosamine pyrophosphorylase/glucosamine-1-phosphate N-acetyltransferase
VKAIVLAAGYGKRLMPITSNRPKHLLEIAGKPILRRILDSLQDNDVIEHIFVVVHQFSEQIEGAVNHWYNNDKSKATKISFVFQPEPLGTGDAVHCVTGKMDSSDSFLVVYGDLILGNAISDIISRYQKLPKDDGIILGVHMKDANKYGVLEFVNNKLVRIQEKPNQTLVSGLINGGLYILPPVMKEHVANLQLSERNEMEFTDVITSLIESGTSIELLELREGWYDIGHPWQILEANAYALELEKNEFSQLGEIEAGVNINGILHLSKTAKIRSGVYIEGLVYVDDGADIGPNCYIRGSTYLGKNTRVGNACEVKNSVIYSNTHVAHLSYVGDSILGEYCNLGAGTITANLRHDDKNIKVTTRGKREDSGRRKLGVIMGNQVKTGIGVNILPGVKISSGSKIDASENVKRDV